MTPWPVAVGFVAPIAGWLADKRYPAGILGGIGLATMNVGLVPGVLAPLFRDSLDLIVGVQTAALGWEPTLAIHHHAARTSPA
jgi:DHA2 family multidrug resistance protein-like MFS transporter